jgi:glycerophosphoryl diester phosphodiesterase
MRRATLAYLAAALVACGGDAADPVEPLAIDPTPPPEAFLAPSTYDCTAGAVEPPPRPQPTSCFSDAACDAPLIAGHRMATPFAPENSLSALRAAVLLGVDIVETDVRLTADGQVVILHDGTVDRTLEGTGEVAALTLVEIQAMPMRADGRAGDFSCDRAPTLDEIFAVASGKIVVELEVKSTEAGVIAAEYLRDHALYTEAFLLCSRSECEAIRAVVPDAPIMSRPEVPAEVAMELDYDPPPILVHVDPTDGFASTFEAIAAAGAKPFANAFLHADLTAASGGGFDGYPAMFDSGLSVVQCELPHYALVGLGRLPMP